FVIKHPFLRDFNSVFTSWIAYGKVFIMAGNLSTVLEYNLFAPMSYLHRFTQRFNKFLPISKSSFVLQKLDNTGKNSILCKFDKNSGKEKEIGNFFDKVADGGLSTSGMLHYNLHNNYLYYIHHYTNRIIQMDTNLKLVNLLYTIDSITTPQIKVKTINTKDKTIYT